MWHWFRQHETLLFWLTGLSIGSLVLTAILLPIVVLRLPSDYFVREHRLGQGPRGWLDWVWHFGKNALGIVFVLAGIAMLVLPGQGLLTVLIGVLMLDFPGKRKLERKLIVRPRILALVNGLRARRGRPPLITEAPVPATPATETPAAR
jgi:hypothetical protein